jgi:hypothetical protein
MGPNNTDGGFKNFVPPNLGIFWCLPDEGSRATLDEVPDGSSTALERVIAGVVISFLPHANQSG